MKKLKGHAYASYVLMTYDINNGGGISYAKKTLKEREQKEDFEGCIGIKRAIDEFIQSHYHFA